MRTCRLTNDVIFLPIIPSKGKITHHNQDGVIVLTAPELAKIMRKSTSWVYNHAKELGASWIGRSPIFTMEGLKDALSRTRRNMEGSCKDREKERSPKERLHLIQSSSSMGSIRKKEASKAARAKELGIILPDH